MNHPTRQYSISPGNLTSCWRGVYYEKKNHPKPDMHPEIKDTLNFFRTLGEKGMNIQQFLTKAWKKKGVLIETEGWLPDNDWNLRGKYDAICDDGGIPTLVEIKGAGNDFFNFYKENKIALPAHRDQLKAYYLTLKNNFEDLATKIVYVNRSTKEVLTLDMEYADTELEELKQNIEKLHYYLENDELPPACRNTERHLVTGNLDLSITALTCRYHSLCAQDDEWYLKTKNEITRGI